MLSDQDVLTALLSSEEFHTVPVKLLRRGSGIIQYFGKFGFTLAERVTCMLRGMPIFIHSQHWKPWLASADAKPEGFRGKIHDAYRDLSPYTLTAKALAPIQTDSWTRPRSKLSFILRWLGFGFPQLVGLPLAAAFDLKRAVKTLFGSTSLAVRARRVHCYFRDAFLRGRLG